MLNCSWEQILENCKNLYTYVLNEVSQIQHDPKFLFRPAQHGKSAQARPRRRWPRRRRHREKLNAEKNKFCVALCTPNVKENASLGHPFSLVSAARSAENILLLQPLRAQRKDNFDNAKHGHPFSLVFGSARSTIRQRQTG